MALRTDSDFIRRMRDQLAQTYTARETARLLAHDTGLDLTHIDFANSPITFWQAIVEEAVREGKIEALLTEAISGAPAVEELASLLAEYQARVAAGSPLSAPALDTAASAWILARRIAVGLVLVLILLGAAAAGYAMWRAPDQMSGVFNVAVAEFGSPGPDNRPQSSAYERELSRLVFEQLQEVLPAALPPGNPVATAGRPRVQVWHDSLSRIQKKAQVGIVEGDTLATREEQARARAHDLAADLLIYGNVEGTGPDARLWLRFYAPGLADSRELLGEQQMGTPIPVNPAGHGLGVSYEITSRVAALTYIAVGLHFELEGQPARAAENFGRAVATPGWTDNQGKEVGYLFLGRAQRQAARKNVTNDAWLDDAAASFAKSLAITLALNREYARPYLGLGNVLVDRAERQAKDQLDERLRLIDEALTEYARAIELAEYSPGEAVEVKARLDRSTAYQAQAQAEMDAGHYPEADDACELMIGEGKLALAATDEAEKGRPAVSPALLAELRALANYDLAIAYNFKGWLWCPEDPAKSLEFYDTARGYYAQCVQWADTQFPRSATDAAGQTAAAEEDLSQSLKDLRTDCVNQGDYVQQCYKGLQGGQNVCTANECAIRQPKDSD